MLAQRLEADQQIPLIHVVERSDTELANTIEGEWFEILANFDWAQYRGLAAEYYNALRDFNETPPKRSQANGAQPNPETADEAKQRLLFERATAPMPSDEATVTLREPEPKTATVAHSCPSEVAPGQVPAVTVGRLPKCFFALLKSFLGVSLMGFAAEPENVALLLRSNPAFARVCGFALADTRGEAYHPQHVPSQRKLEQFDQIMTDYGLWARIKLAEVQRNLTGGVIEPEPEWVGDTTHYHAYSSFEVVPYKDAKGRENKKSQSKPTKRCGCLDWHHCPHEWHQRDEGAGTIVKQGKKMIWGHKASVIGLPNQGVALDAVAVADAATHDGQTFLPHIERLFEAHPQLSASVQRVLYDSACDDGSLKKAFKDQFGVDLKASFNPRRSKPVTEGLPRGIEKITPHGVPICWAGHEFDYQGIRYANERFIYRAPVNDNGHSVCTSCPFQSQCCNHANTSGRTITVSFERLKHIDATDPPMAKRFKAIMTRRPSVERMIKRLKCDLGDDRLSKRGNDSFQAYLDKTMISYHLLLRYLH